MPEGKHIRRPKHGRPFSTDDIGVPDAGGSRVSDYADMHVSDLRGLDVSAMDFGRDTLDGGTSSGASSGRRRLPDDDGAFGYARFIGDDGVYRGPGKHVAVQGGDTLSKTQPQPVASGYKLPDVSAPADSSCSAYAPYGSPTSRSADYEAWANAGQGGSGDAAFALPKKRHTARNVFLVILGLILVALIVVGVAIGLYLKKLDAALDLGDRRADIEAVLTKPTPGQPYYVLLIGSDSREGVAGSDAQWAGHDGTAGDQRADVMMLARIDEQNDTVSLLTIPRDTAWWFDKGYLGKLNYTYTSGGVPYTVKAVQQLTGIPISHVVEIHMSGLMGLVDTVGGIQMNVQIPVDYHEALTSEPVHFDTGVQTLNGAQTEVYARERLAYAESGDMHRQSVVREIVEAIIDKVRKAPLTELPNIILKGAECVDTDLTSIDVLKIMWGLGRNAKMMQGTAPYKSEINEYTTPAGQYIVLGNDEGWKRAIEVFTSGADPSTLNYDNDETYVVGEKEFQNAQ